MDVATKKNFGPTQLNLEDITRLKIGTKIILHRRMCKPQIVIFAGINRYKNHAYYCHSNEDSQCDYLCFTDFNLIPYKQTGTWNATNWIERFVEPTKQINPRKFCPNQMFLADILKLNTGDKIKIHWGHETVNGIFECVFNGKLYYHTDTYSDHTHCADCGLIPYATGKWNTGNWVERVLPDNEGAGFGKPIPTDFENKVKAIVTKMLTEIKCPNRPLSW